MKRSNAPIFWLLFGAGGMLSALIGAVLVFCSGLAAPLGLLLPADAFSYERTLAFAQGWLGKFSLFVLISLFFWHSAHRIFHTLHDLGIHAGSVAKGLCYGSAMLGTVATILALSLL